MNFHICTENPCPLQDKEYAEKLKNGFSYPYLKDAKFAIKVDAEEVKKWIGSKGTA